jgi:hypothetical protein
MISEPKYLLLIGFVMLVVGVALPFLMVMQIIESTFFLNFLAYSASVVGTVLGLLGAMSIAVRNRNRNRD